MLGFLDEQNSAFFTVDCGQSPLDFLIDTGFNGALIIGEELFDSANAVDAGTVSADLASDQSLEYESYLIQFEWLGQPIQTRVLVGPGKDCLLGTALLNPHRLEIDFGQRTVRLVESPEW